MSDSTKEVLDTLDQDITGNPNPKFEMINAID